MEIYNHKTKQWKEEKAISARDVQAVIGKGIRIEVDSHGNIKIDKILTPQEKAKVEAL